MSSQPLVTVVTAVLDRPVELRRCLSSLAAQSMGDFECIVVDDASRVPIAPVVAAHDERFIYVRNASNLGPAGAKRVGFRRMRGPFLSILDSDDEYFPWALERATTHLAKRSDVGGVTGLWVYPDGLRVRFANASAVFTREDYLVGNTPRVDCLPMVRRASVEEWLGRRHEYFATEFAFWLSHRLRHDQLFVDEPWGRKHIDAQDRVSTRRDPRLYRDVATFVEEYRDEIGADACAPLDRFLRQAWLSLLRGGRWKDARTVGAWLDERGIGKSRTVAEAASSRARRRLSATSQVAVLSPLTPQREHALDALAEESAARAGGPARTLG